MGLEQCGMYWRADPLGSVRCKEPAVTTIEDPRGVQAKVCRPHADTMTLSGVWKEVKR